MSRPRSVNPDLPPKLVRRRTAAGTLYYYAPSAAVRIPLGDSLTDALERYRQLHLGQARRRATTKRFLSREHLVARSVVAPDGPCVYFLIRRGEIVYVGRAVRLFRRLGQHLHDGKEFDAFSFITCALEEVDVLEARYIEALKPRWNALSYPRVHNRSATPSADSMS